MKIFPDLKSYNKYHGLLEPLNNDIDLGYYDQSGILSKS